MGRPGCSGYPWHVARIPAGPPSTTGAPIPGDVDIVSGEGAERAFRPDLEGFRAVAVVLVLLFHASVPGFSGGYVGVDVFFVLSGFLITGLLLRELQATGRVSLAAFYARRARRLLPAAAVVLAATAVASAVILPPLQMPDVAGDIAWSAGYASNIRFALQATDYLAADMAPSPVLHYWSLGVEEQFYLVWPALLVVVAGAAFAAGDSARALRRVLVTLGVVFATSLVAAIWLTGVQQPWAFFSLPARAWELAIGGLLAMPRFARLGDHRLGPIVGWAGLAMVVASAFVITDRTPFPGVAALFPTIGSGMVIAGGLGRVGPNPLAGVRAWRLPETVLSLPPIRYVGRISYSLYLWHWPVLVLPALAMGRLPGPVRLALVGLAVLLAAASHRWVEEPLRHGRFIGVHPPRVLAFAGLLSLAVAVSAAGLSWRGQQSLGTVGPALGGSIEDVELPPSASPGTSGSPGASGGPDLPPLAAGPVPADLAPSLATARDDLPVVYADGCHVDPPSREPTADCTYGDRTSETTIFLFGDSHAAQWFPALERLSTEHGWRFLSMTKSACASVDVPIWSTIFSRPYDECTAWREYVFRQIEETRPALVVLSNSRRFTLEINGERASSVDHPDLWSAGLLATIDRIEATGARVVLIGDTVRQAEDPPVCLSANLGDASACATPYRTAVPLDAQRVDLQVAKDWGGTYIDPTPWMCFTDPCPSVIGRFLVYRDEGHLTATYARALARKLFELLPAFD